MKLLRSFLCGITICCLTLAPAAAGINHGKASGGGGAATFVASATYNMVSSTDANVTFATSGVQNGDILLLAILSSGSSSGISFTMNSSSTAMTLLHSPVPTTTGDGWAYPVYWHVLTNSEILNGKITGVTPGENGALTFTAVYRGATTATYGTDVNAASPLVFPGVSPTLGAKGFVLMASGGGQGARAVTVSPGSWTNRLGNVVPGGFWDTEVDDLLAGYTNTSTTMAGWGSPGNRVFGTLIGLN